ncbi:MAG TPA: adenylosuccinate lyase, partial [Spirochaetota bacterium]|nr:adenylosuccinate lyase [Spirochaetota bacterium]
MIDRYARKEIADIWTLENKFRIWLDIEIAACEAHAQLGVIPAAALAIIKDKASFTVERITEIENQVHHDVIAFLTCVGGHV